MRIVVVIALLLVPAAASPCQVTCEEFVVRNGKGQLLRNFDVVVAEAKLIVREASFDAGPEAFCMAWHEGSTSWKVLRKGPVITVGKTDKRGRFSFRLKPGRYWITYSHVELGESFLVSVSRNAEARQLALRLEDFTGNVCFKIDVERNATKPPGWPLPLKDPEKEVQQEGP